MSLDLILIPISLKVEMEYTVSKHYVPYPKYSTCIQEIVIMQQCMAWPPHAQINEAIHFP